MKTFFSSLTFLITIIIASECIAFESDTLVSKSDLIFNNTEEESNFQFKDDSHYIDLLYYTDNYNINVQQFELFKSELAALIEDLKINTIKSKKPAKKIKVIYNAIHDKFLTKYQLHADFHELIEDGTYNCVTATALYAWVFEELDIPYTIKETPKHVYIIAFPKSDQIIVESTDPTKGYIYHSNEYKNSFVQNLRNSKLISEQEYRSQDVNELFEKYYYFDKDIDFRQLISIHYSNNAVAYLEKEEFRDFQKQIKKASFLYPCPRNTFLLFTSTILLLENVDYSEKQQVDDLIFLTRFIDHGISSQDILNEFIRITYEYLVNSSRPEELDSIYFDIKKSKTPPDFKEELAFYYNYEKGRYFMIKGQYNMAFPYVKEAFGLKSGNSDAQTNLIANLSNFLIIDESGIETLSKIDSIAIEYPEILENNNFVRVYGLCQLKSIESHFKNKNPELGNETIADFEKLNGAHETIRFDENFIGRAYSEAAVYYFKKGQNKKCREYLNRGRELAPNSNELKSRLIMLQ